MPRRIGVAPEDWQRPGRHGLHFVAEADLHRGELTAWTVPRLPPALRAGSTCEPLRVPFAQLPAATAAARSEAALALSAVAPGAPQF